MATAPADDNPAPARKVIFAEAETRALLDGHIDALCRPGEHGWQEVKQSTSRTVYRGRIGDREIYLKHFHPPRRGAVLRRLAWSLRGSRARRELRYAQYLRERGVATPAPLAAMCNGQLEWYAARAVAPAEAANVWHESMLAAVPRADGHSSRPWQPWRRWWRACTGPA